MFFLPALWGFIEIRMASADFSRRSVREILRWHRSVFAWVGLIIAVGVGSQVAISAGVLDAEWGPAARRLDGVLFGAGMAIWGNYLPKTLSPWNVEEAPFDWQRVHRFGGWTFSIGGVALVLVWLTLPPGRGTVGRGRDNSHGRSACRGEEVHIGGGVLGAPTTGAPVHHQPGLTRP